MVPSVGPDCFLTLEDPPASSEVRRSDGLERVEDSEFATTQ